MMSLHRRVLGWVMGMALICMPVWSETTVTADEAHYDGTSVHLTGHVHVVSDMGTLLADTAIVDMETLGTQTWQATHVTLIGHVTMQNGERTQCALADHVDIFPQDKIMIFEASPGARVLFIDTVQHIQLSATKVKTERGTTDRIEGYGDVRCVLGTDEIERLKTQFSRE